jgi:type IV pilus assembly protein PilB
VELLLGEALLTATELAAAGPARWRWCSDLSWERCQELGCLPVQQRGDALVLAVPSHWDPERRRQLQAQLNPTGPQLSMRLALPAEIAAQLASEQPTPQEAEALSGREGETGLSSPRNAPVVALVDKVLVEALRRGASDIHLEPQEDGLLIRLRQDGVLEALETLPKQLIAAVTSRVKVMADLDIAERRLPQDGRIRRSYQGNVFDLRVSTLPSRHGEKVCIRLLNSGATHLGLDKLISDPIALASVRDMGHKPFGMLLVTGPTGSGKSTTLYALLAERNSPEVNISTVEDPIEYTLNGITQTQVNREKGYDFALALRAFMRQDPDVLLVGETRDQETAQTAIEAALTGHLVLTTLHCNDAPSAIARLSDMGVEPFLISASLLGIVSQRLVRRVCPDCRLPHQPSSAELARFGLLASREESIHFFQANRRGHGSGGCRSCQGLGYKGRIGVYEVLRSNEAMAAAIAKRASTDQIRRLALEAGMKTLLGYGLDLVRQGYTTLEEIERMILTDSALESERRSRALHTITCRSCGAGLRDTWLECPYCLTARSIDD